MAYQFQKHYTRDEARGLLPQIRQWLARSARTAGGAAENRGAPGRADGPGLRPRRRVGEYAGLEPWWTWRRCCWNFSGGRSRSRTFSAGWLISRPSSAGGKCSCAGSRTRRTSNSGTNWMPATPGGNGCRARRQTRDSRVISASIVRIHRSLPAPFFEHNRKTIQNCRKGHAGCFRARPGRQADLVKKPVYNCARTGYFDGSFR